MAIEDVFLSNNPSSALKLGQARGGKLQSDTADGLAIALSHAHVGATKQRLQEALLK